MKGAKNDMTHIPALQRALIFPLLAFCLAAMLALPVSAAEPDQTEGVQETVGWESKWNEAYALVKKLSLPLGALSIAYGGLCWFGIGIFSGQKAQDETANKGKQIILTTILAIFAIYMLPVVISAGKSVFSSPNIAWAP